MDARKIELTTKSYPGRKSKKVGEIVAQAKENATENVMMKNRNVKPVEMAPSFKL